MYKFRKIIGKHDFPYHLKKISVRYNMIGHNIDVLRQTTCLVVNPIKVNSFAYLFNCTTVGFRLNDGTILDLTQEYYGRLVTPIPGRLMSGLSWFNWWVSFAPECQCCYFCESSSLFYLSLNLIARFLK